ncbi:MAG: hypothetical protein IJL89_03950 [Firmicutes bacterium]|nr:hypothetical protein [Bacillota bacterium]
MKKRILAGALALIMLAGCGGKADEETVAAIQSRITAVDTEIGAMYGKVDDMYQTGRMDDELYNRFTELDERADELLGEAVTAKNASKMEERVKSLEDELAGCKQAIDELNEKDDDSLATDLVVVSFAVEEQEKLMKRALENGKITQEKMDEFLALKERVEKFNRTEDLKYDNKFKRDFGEIRQQLTTLASEAGADNALIDRLMGSETQQGETAENTEKTENTASQGGSETAPEAKTEEPATEIITQSQAAHALPEEAEQLNQDYIDFQNAMLERQKAGEVSDSQLMEIIKLGIELTYLKEAIEKDGVTENNTYTSQDIRQRLYDKAVELGYEKAEVFK